MCPATTVGAAELADPQVLGLGLREGARLLAAVCIRLDGDSADGYLDAPDLANDE